MYFDVLAFLRIHRIISQLNHFAPIFVVIVLVGRATRRLILDVDIEIRFIIILFFLILLAICSILCLCLLDLGYPGESFVREHVELLLFLLWHHSLTQLVTPAAILTQKFLGDWHLQKVRRT